MMEVENEVHIDDLEYTHCNEECRQSIISTCPYIPELLDKGIFNI